MQLSKLFSFIVVALLVAVVFAGLVSIPAAAAVTDTMQFRYNAAHTGDYSPVAGTTQPNGLLKWSFQTESDVVSSPAVANGVVYVGVAPTLYALNAQTGAKLWSYTTGDWWVQSSPAVANGVVYVGDSLPNGSLYALNATTGAELWNYTVKTGQYPGGCVRASPAVANGVVYAGSAYAVNSENGTLLQSDYNVYALDANNGTKLWNYTTGGMVESSPAVVNGVVYIGSDDGNLYAFGNQSAGKWGPWTSLSGQFTASPAAVSWADGRIDLFGRGSDNALWWRNYSNSAWSSWTSLSGQLAPTTGPAVSSQREGQLDVFVIGSDNALWQRSYA